jgi:hypothetical protein
MRAHYPGTTVRRLKSSVLVVKLFLAGCSLIGSSQEGTEARSPTPAQEVSVISEGNYIESCRAKGVPIPPDWKLSSEWESHGNLKTILLTPNNLDQVPADDTSFASVWSYAPPQGRGACIALGRSSGSFQVICQSATTGHACFWGNASSHSAGTSWTPETAEVPIASLRDPVQGFAPGTVPCTECHRGNNAFLYAPDDPTWATVLRSEHPRPTFTTRVEQSSHQGKLTFGATTITYPRFIPIGGASMALNNPLPTAPGCSGSCHELHSEILERNHTAEGYVKVPRPMGPNCVADSPPDDPTRNCYQR